MKKRVLTWIKPTAQQLHLWNYLGAVLPMLEFQNQDDKEIFMFVANFHASNQLQNKQQMQENILNIVKTAKDKSTNNINNSLTNILKLLSPYFFYNSYPQQTNINTQVGQVYDL